MKSYQQFFAEMKRRRVFRVMAVYGAVGHNGDDFTLFGRAEYARSVSAP